VQDHQSRLAGCAAHVMLFPDTLVGWLLLLLLAFNLVELQ
jgi:hypothetical protein